MSENSTPEERTEAPTGKRMGHLRREGAIHQSTEITQVVSFITAFLVIGLLWSYLFNSLGQVLTRSYKLIARTEPLDIRDLHQGFMGLVLQVGPWIFLFVISIAAASSLSVMLQTDWNIKEKKIQWKGFHINPLNGIKRIFSLNNLVVVLKAILKLALILPIGYQALKKFAPDMIALQYTSIEFLLKYCGQAIMHIFWKVMYVLIALAIFDYFWGKHRWLKQNRMTKQEVKEERKAMEGDETTKRQIIQKGLQRIWTRLKTAVPKADVIITNPTHYAIALKYDRLKMKAPVVVAKGRGYVALRIREIAFESGVPILERPPLARALYKSSEVGSEIPYELYRAVAEVLAYVFKIRNPHASRQIQPAQQQEMR